MDLRFPPREDVNSRIDIDDILGHSIKYSLPSINNLITRLRNIGLAVYVWKADLARACRQLRLDPLDVPLMGFIFKDQFYLDLCPPFRVQVLQCSMSACLKYSHLHPGPGWSECISLDDFAGAQPDLHLANYDYDHFINITNSLGLKLPPAQKVKWLGYEVDSIKMSISIPQYKLNQVLDECKSWMNKSRSSKVMI